MNQSYHILQIPYFYPQNEKPLWGIFFKEQFNALSRENIKVGIIYPENRSIRELNLKKLKDNHFQIKLYDEDGVYIYRKHGWNIIPHKFTLGIYIWINEAVKLGIKYIKKFGKPDIIHAHNACYAGYAAKILSDKFYIPYVITEHSSGHFLNNIKLIDKLFLRGIYNNSKINITVSNELKKLLCQKYSLSSDKFMVIPNMVDTDFFTVKPKIIDDNFFSFLTICNLVPIKNVDILIKAFYKAFKDNKNVMLKIGGIGSEYEKLKKIVIENNIEDKVKFLGILTREKVKEEMQKSNVFVLASKYETFGVVLIEALATGTPVIATKCGGPNDIVKDGVGVLVKPNDINELIKALKYIYKNYQTYDSYKIRNYCYNNFGQKITIKTVIDLYSKAIDSR
ncbi:glycosyltransferase [Thermoanaerobacterium sp. RBIITD]|uniref:glycosyltransferase n=1 Tax=Thermoanaerobacterium sp. RBIITD TaxID=1550240 RepID=UPI000BB71461|nr:glycosyltransferase [Thermoanaerobacterium sp. RBIITD]SNX52921.1 Glycosyltransferase involved in cell wall bisynthesis [Thermoanaerobacterium sp. RBIITD]